MNFRKAYEFLSRNSDKKNLDSLIFFVTSVCNAKCGTCFYWQNLNQKGDLTFEEIEKISRTAPPFRYLLLSGGEPTLRKRLVDIVGLFSTNNKIQSVSMPTNGLIPKLVEETAIGFSKLRPDLSVSIALSIDGYGKTHDEIRGVPGNYEKAIQSLEKLITLRDNGHPNLNVSVSTVVCSRNIHEVKDFADHLLKNYDLDNHTLIMIRGEPMVQSLILSDKKAVRDFKLFHRDLMFKYGSRRRAQNRGSKSYLGKLYEWGAALETQDITYKNLVDGSYWPFPCLAGNIIGVIDWNGDVRSCELRKPVANLRSYDNDFSKLWNGPEMGKEIEAIAADKCFCTHGCFLQPSQAHDKTSSLLRGPLKGLVNYLTNSSS